MDSLAKRPVEAIMVKLLFHKQFDRGMTLAPFETRCTRQGEIHELVTTDHREANVGDQINRVGFLGFAEILVGGILEKGDSVWVGEKKIGTVLGFDECHFPNHYNVLIAVEELVTANDLALQVEQLIRFGSTQTQVPHLM